MSEKEKKVDQKGYYREKRGVKDTDISASGTEEEPPVKNLLWAGSQHELREQNEL